MIDLIEAAEVDIKVKQGSSLDVRINIFNDDDTPHDLSGYDSGKIEIFSRNQVVLAFTTADQSLVLNSGSFDLSKPEGVTLERRGYNYIFSVMEGEESKIKTYGRFIVE